MAVFAQREGERQIVRQASAEVKRLHGQLASKDRLIEQALPELQRLKAQERWHKALHPDAQGGAKGGGGGGGGGGVS
jgi:hypothetical protein